MDEHTISPAGDPFYATPHHGDQDDSETVEAHYASLERLECASCFGGYLTITVEEDGQEHDEAVPCRRCAKGK